MLSQYRSLQLGSVVLLACSVASSNAVANVGPERGNEAHLTLRHWGGPPIRVLAYRPQGCGPDCPLVLAFHGMLRNGSRTFETWKSLSDRYGFVVAAPEYPASSFPGNLGYAQGGLRRLTKKQDSAFRSVEPIARLVERRFGLAQHRFSMFGHSAGAQFVHRYVLLNPSAPVDRAVVANAGWYTLPVPTLAWPYGLQGAPQQQSIIRTALGRRLTVLIGESDRDAADPHLRQTRAARQQGRNRFDRGLNFYRTAQLTARRRNIPFHWSLLEVPNLGHDSRSAAIASARLFRAHPQIAAR